MAIMRKTVKISKVRRTSTLKDPKITKKARG